MPLDQSRAGASADHHAPRDETAAAIHAYEHAAAAARRSALRLDILEAPRRRHTSPPAWSAPPAPHADRITHAVAAPAGTAFKLGFGFAAGVAAFRLIALTVMGTGLLLAARHVFGLITG